MHHLDDRIQKLLAQQRREIEQTIDLNFQEIKLNQNKGDYCCMVFFNILVYIIFPPLLCCSFFEVRPNESVILEMFGTPVWVCSEPGLHFYLPLCNRLIRVSKALQTVEIKGSSVPDLHGSPLNVSVVITYKIDEPLPVTYNVIDYQ